MKKSQSTLLHGALLAALLFVPVTLSADPVPSEETTISVATAGWGHRGGYWGGYGYRGGWGGGSYWGGGYRPYWGGGYWSGGGCGFGGCGYRGGCGWGGCW